jgi:cytoskeletal protein RodZ
MTFDDAAQPAPPPAPPPPAHRDKAMTSINHRPRRLAAPAIAVAVVLVLIVVLLLTGSHKAPPSHTHPSKKNSGHNSSAQSKPPKKKSTSTTSTPPPPAVSSPQAATTHSATYDVADSSFTVTLTATSGACWVDATSTATGATLFSGSLAAGGQHSFSAAGPVTVIVGAPTVLKATVDGGAVVLPAGFQTPFTMSFVPTAATSGPVA